MFFGQIQMDTLDSYLIDTVLTTLKVLTEKVDQLKQTNDRSNFIPFLSALAGAGLAVGTQLLIKYFDARRERNKLIMDSKIHIIELKSKLRFQLKDLAYFSQNAEYQYWQSLKEDDQTLKYKCIEEHYKSSAKRWDVDVLISETISKYISVVRKYYLLKNITDINTDEFIKIIDFKFQVAKDYSDPVKDYHNEVSQDIEVLSEKYMMLFQHLDVVEKNII